MSAGIYNLTDRLHGEFTDWWKEMRVRAKGQGNPVPPLDDWSRIEQFMEHRYPAAHRGLDMGMEAAQPLIDETPRGLYGDAAPLKPAYPTGADAIAEHGYDPKEIAAGMLLLHNEAHGERQDLSQVDHDRLYEIARKRSRMQRDYEKRQKVANQIGGDCYEAAAHYMLDNAYGKRLHQLRLVHGEVAGQFPLNGKTYGHAWIEDGDTVIDRSNGRNIVMPKADYYALGQIDKLNNFHVYTFEEARAKMLEHEVYGPWDLKGKHPNYYSLDEYNRTASRKPEPMPMIDDVLAKAAAAIRYAMPAVDAYDSSEPQLPRVPAPKVPQGKWYHASPHDLPDDTVLVPGGGRSQWGDEHTFYRGWEERPDWVWMSESPNLAKSWGRHIYEVEPLDDGPWPWNGPEAGSGHVSPRARIIRKLTQEELYPEQKAAASRTAMPVPRNVPSNHITWEKQRTKLNDKAQKAGVPVELVPNFPMDINDFYDQAAQHERHLLRPVEYEGKGVPGGISHRYLEVGNGKIPVNYLLHHGDDGRINGILCHFPKGTPYEKPGSITVTVHPHHRGKGVGSKLVTTAQEKFGIDLDQQEYTPLGYELYRNVKHQQGETVPNIFNEPEPKPEPARSSAEIDAEYVRQWAKGVRPKITNNGVRSTASRHNAALGVVDLIGPAKKGEDLYVNGLIDRMSGEFDKWWEENPDPDWWDSSGRGPIGTWENVESFLKKKYPAAHKPKFWMGHEHAGPALDGKARAKYKTGPEAVAKYGYDPKEIAATMLMLHSQTHMGRVQMDGWMQADLDRIYDVYRKRQHLQESAKAAPAGSTQRQPDENTTDFDLKYAPEYSQHRIDNGLTKAAASNRTVSLSSSPDTDSIIYGLSSEFDEWAKANNKGNPYDDAWREGAPRNWKPRGPVGYWPNIEEFMKEKYPAAHRGLSMGFEDAMPLLDGENEIEDMPWLNGAESYETGHAAQQKYGYDPKEVVSALLLLHNDTHPGRENYLKSDQARLLDIAQKRHKMQQAYEKSQKKYNEDWVLAAAHSAIREAAEVIKPKPNPELHANGVLHRLYNEFTDWADINDAQNPYDDPNSSGYHGDERGPIGFWPNIEEFLKEKYPASHRDLSEGWEDAKPLLDNQHPHNPNNNFYNRYETGPGAEAKYGYDPKEIVAALLLLHNQTHPYRTTSFEIDQERLYDVAKKRFKMQREWEERNKAEAEYQERVNGGVVQKAAAALRYAQQILLESSAKLSGELLANLESEFRKWSKNQSYSHHITNWPSIEGFLLDNYPAAHRGFEMGLEEARPLVRGEPNTLAKDYPVWFDGYAGKQDYDAVQPYETGPEAVAKHGYDPHHVAAGMVLLHNLANGTIQPRDKEIAQDVDFLHDIFKKRVKMQRDYEESKVLVDAAKTLRTAERVLYAAVTQDTIEQLNKQFHEWYDAEGFEALIANDPNMGIATELGEFDPDPDAVKALKEYVENGRQQEIDRRGPIGYWPNIENFLKKHYPAAHKNYAAGMEQAGPELDYTLRGQGVNPEYETGPKAMSKHGYDPAEIAASMVLLHNQSHPLRGHLVIEDMNRLVKIYQIRENMQRKYEERLKKKKKDLVTASIDYDDTAFYAVAWDDEDDDDGPPQKHAYSDQTKFQTDFADDLKTGEPLDEQQQRFIDYLSRFNDMKRNQTGDYTPRGGWPKNASLNQILRIAASGDTNLDDLFDAVNKFIMERKPINPETRKPHTPETAWKNWLTGIVPFIQAVHPDLPYERYRYEPHTRSLDEYSDVPATIAKLVALHTREKYGVTTMYNRLKNDEIQQMAKTLTTDTNNLFAKGYGVNDQGNLVLMPTPTIKEYPRGEDLRRRMMMPRNPQAQPNETTPKPQGMGGKAASILREAEAVFKMASMALAE